MTVSLQDPYEGQLIAGRYHVGRRIGAGGTAHVYSAVQEPIGREVAVKILRSDLEGNEAAQIAERLLREAQLIARLSHPGIVTVHDCGILQNGAVYLVMERVRGVPLSTLLAGPLEPHRAARLAAGVARALRHAHVNGVIHRDVKPSNVLICTGDDGEEIPKLLDFGIGKGMAEDSQTTVVGRFVGTPQYASPEQAEGLGEVDGRADIYSLGCMMYRMLTGVLPFEADTALGVAFKQVHAPWPPMATRTAIPVDPVLEGIVRRAMEKRPEDRWADADAMLTALEAWERPDRGAIAPAPVTPAPIPEEEVSGAMTLLDTLNGRLSVGVGVPPGPPRNAPKTLPKSELPPDPSPTPRSAGRLGLALGGLLLLGFVGVLGLGTGIWWWTHRSAPDDLQLGVGEGELMAPAASDLEKPTSDEGVSSAGGSATTPSTGSPVGANSAEVAIPSAGGASTSGGNGPGTSVKDAIPLPASNGATTTPARPSHASTPHSPQTAKLNPAKSYSSAIYIDSLLVQPADATRALHWINTADESALRASGIYARGVNLILQKRPFPSLEAFAATPYIGTKSVESAIKASH